MYGDPRHIPALRGLGADGKASRGAKVKGQEAPQHLGFLWHGTRLNVAQRGVDRKTNETTVIGPVIDGMDLAGVCLTVDALHSLVDLNKRVLARGGHVIFVIKGNFTPEHLPGPEHHRLGADPRRSRDLRGGPRPFRPAPSRSPPPRPG